MRGESELTDRLKLDPIMYLLLIRQKLAAIRRIGGFFGPDLGSLRSPFLVPSVRGTIGHLGGTLNGGRGVLVCKSCSMSNAATISLICGCLHPCSSTLSCCVPSQCSRKCKVSCGKVGCTQRGKVALIVSLSYNVGTVRGVRCTGRLKVSFVVYSRRVPSSALPSTITMLSTGQISSICPCRRLSKYNIKFGFVRTFTGDGGFPFTSLRGLLRLATIDVTSSVIPVANRGHVLTCCNLGRLGDGPDLNLGKVVSVYNLSNGRVAVDSVIFGVKPHVGTSNHVVGKGRTIRLLLTGSISITHRGDRDVGRCGRRHHRLSGGVASRTGTVVSRFRGVRSHGTVVICGPK